MTRRFLSWFVLSLAMLAMFGCATPPDNTIAAGQPVSDRIAADDMQWYYLRFRFARNSEGETDSYLDLLVANEIAAPVLDAHNDAVALWRFHRRWANDAAGHQFSLIVMTDPQTVEQMAGEIRSTPLLRQLQADGYLREFLVNQPSNRDPGAVAATSDGSWPELLQREWPHFIMGASRMWLGLVQAEARRADGSDLHARYSATANTINDLWFSKGNHALFHHLSALFGYQPLKVIRRDIMTF